MQEERDPPCSKAHTQSVFEGGGLCSIILSVLSADVRVRFTFPVGVSPETVRGDGGRVNR
eukprot:COSAG03_NODE_422_length_8037_cov_3.643613_2_plen_60_part_00